MRCRNCGEPVVQLATPWGTKWYHAPTTPHRLQFERFCRLQTADPEESR